MQKIALFARDPKNCVSSKEIDWDLYLSRYDNLGNLVWTYGISKALQTPANKVTYIDPINPQLPVDEINERFDHIVFSFANLIDPQKALRIRFLADIISRIKIPVTICSVGVQSGGIESYDFLEPIKNDAKRLLAKCLDQASCIGTRGDFTTDCLSRLGFAHHVRTVGCPSFFIKGRGFAIQKKSTYPENARAVFHDTEGARRCLFNFAKTHFDGRFKYVTQGYIKPSENDPIVLQLIAEKKIHLFGDFQSWNEFLSSFDLSISSRIHGTVMALLAGVPAVIVSVDARTQEMAELLRIPQLSLSDLSLIPSGREFYEKTSFTELNQRYLDLIDNYASFLSGNGLDHFLNYAPEVSANYYESVVLKQQFKDDDRSSLVEIPKFTGWFMRTPAYRQLARIVNKIRS